MNATRFWSLVLRAFTSITFVLIGSVTTSRFYDVTFAARCSAFGHLFNKIALLFLREEQSGPYRMVPLPRCNRKR